MDPQSQPQAGSSSASGSNFDEFYKDLKETEKNTMTSEEQIQRLLRPGSTYRNLNPFEVLLLDPETPIEDIRKKYRRLSILVHPDKNANDRKRAQEAFDAVKKAYEMLDDEKTRKKCYEVVEEAKGRTDRGIEDKKKLLKKQGKDTKVEEDDPDKYKEAVKILTMKLFADLERKRRMLEQRISDEAAKKHEQEVEAEQRRNAEKEFNKNWEESRQGRVDSWQNFKTGKTSGSKKKVKKEKRFSPMGFRPPKTKPENR